MSPGPIPQLIFSTRAARPRAGLEFNRELVASTPDLDPEIRGFFSLRADLTYSTSRQPKLAPVLTFSRIDRDRWLFTRAVSLGRYRKSSHQMLIHGLVLRRQHLEALAGNPFLLTRLDGIELAGEHPGGKRLLPLLRLPAGTRRAAGEMNRQRLEDLRPVLEARYPESFVALFELARSTAPVACVTPGQPDADLVEGLLLHFHPADRPELSFHSWYAQDRRLDYRLLFASEAELPLLRKHFSRLETWTPDRRSPSGDVAELTRELRQRSVADFSATLERFRLTWFRTAPVPAIGTEDARLCLRHGLGQPLDAGEQERCRQLARRSGNPLAACVYDLSAAWPRGHRAFAEEASGRLERLGPVSREMAEQALAEISAPGRPSPAAEDWIQRWALLVLWPRFGPGLSGREARVRAWRRLVPLELLENLAATLLATRAVPDPDGDAASALLDDYVVLDAESLAAAERLPQRPYWPRYLVWLASSGRGLQAMAPRIEAVIANLPRRGRARAWLRQLEAICHSAGLALVAFRLAFQREIELLEPAERSERIRQILGSLLADATGASDKVLRTLFGKPRLAGDLWPALADWMLGSASPETSWSRWRLLVENQGQVLEIETAQACGRFLDRLALSTLATRIQRSCQTLLAARAPEVAEIRFLSRLLEPVARRLLKTAAGSPAPEVSPFLARSVAGLVSARVQSPQPSPGLDQVLMDLLFFTLLHTGDVTLRDAMETFLSHLLSQEGSYLDDLIETDLDEDPLPRRPGGAPSYRLARRREWGHLLMDDLIRSPPLRGLDDPRFRSCLEIGLQQWRAESEPGGAGMIRVLRLLHMPPSSARHPERTRDLFRRLVPEGRAHYAQALIDARAEP